MRINVRPAVKQEQREESKCPGRNDDDKDPRQNVKSAAWLSSHEETSVEKDGTKLDKTHGCDLHEEDRKLKLQGV